MKKIIRIVVILILLAAAGFAIAVVVKKNKDKNNKTTEQVSVIVQDPSSSQPNQSPNGTTPSTQSNAPTPAPVVVSPPVEPATEPTPVADMPPAVVVAQKPTSGILVFKSATGMRVSVPAAWHPQEEVRDGKTYTVFYNMQNEVVASIESFVDFGNTLELIGQQLRSSPMVYNIQHITIASVPALQYETPKGRQLVVVHNSTTYYLSGELAKDYSKIAF